MSIQEHLNKIRNAVYGREVRESIAKGIETAYDDASENGNANMEVKIARGTHPNLRSRLDETTAQLAQKANTSYVNSSMSTLDNKINSQASGSPKGTFATVSELQNAFPNGDSNVYVITADGKWYYWSGTAWTGGGAYQSTGLAVGSVNDTHLQNGSVTASKRMINILPLNAEDWAAATTSLAVGVLYRVPEGKVPYNNSNYRKDTMELIKVKPGTVLNFRNYNSSNYQVGVHEFDADKLGIKDSGYVAETLTLSETTQYVRFIVTKTDSSNFTIENMLDLSGVAIECSIDDYSKEQNYNTITNKLNLEGYSLFENLVNFEPTNWSYGSLNASGGIVTESNDSNRARFSTNYYLNVQNQPRKLYYSIKDDMSLCIFRYKEDGTFISSEDWFDGEGYVFLTHDTAKVKILIAYNDNGQINLSNLIESELVLSYRRVAFTPSKKDLERVVKGKPNINITNTFSGKVRFIGHAGSASLSYENTIEAYKVASDILGVWGAECDLGLTSDDHLVLMHDHTLERTTTGTGMVSDHTLAEIKDLTILGSPGLKVPTFDEYLLICRETGLYPVIEIKNTAHTTGMTDKVIQSLKKFNMINDCMIISFGLTTLRRLRNLERDMPLAYLLDSSATLDQTLINDVKQIGNCAINARDITITKEFVEECHNQGVVVMAWTPNTQETADDLIAMGVDMITTDRVRNKYAKSKVYTSTIVTEDGGSSFSVPVDDTLLKSASLVDSHTVKLEFSNFLEQPARVLRPRVRIVDTTDTYEPLNCYVYVLDGFIYFRFIVDGQAVPINSLGFTNKELNVTVSF